MTNSEKIFDKILGILFSLAFIALLIWGILKLSNTASKPMSSKKEITDSITIECVHCGWLNKRSIIELDTTLKRYKQ